MVIIRILAAADHRPAAYRIVSVPITVSATGDRRTVSFLLTNLGPIDTYLRSMISIDIYLIPIGDLFDIYLMPIWYLLEIYLMPIGDLLESCLGLKKTYILYITYVRVWSHLRIHQFSRHFLHSWLSVIFESEVEFTSRFFELSVRNEFFINFLTSFAQFFDSFETWRKKITWAFWNFFLSYSYHKCKNVPKFHSHIKIGLKSV